MHFLALSLIIALFYSLLKLFSQKISQHKKCVSLDAISIFIILKITMALCLFAYIENSIIKNGDNTTDNITTNDKYLLTLQLLSYTLGDVFILVNELLAIFFFGLGHVWFLNLFMLHQFIEAVTHPVLGLGLIGIPTIVFLLLPNKYVDSSFIIRYLHKIMLIVYMILLYLVWMMPTFHWYFPGMILFVISDLFIVFEWPGAWLAEYMLYVGSLISLYTWFFWN